MMSLRGNMIGQSAIMEAKRPVAKLHFIDAPVMPASVVLSFSHLC